MDCVMVEFIRVNVPDYTKEVADWNNSEDKLAGANTILNHHQVLKVNLIAVPRVGPDFIIVNYFLYPILIVNS